MRITHLLLAVISLFLFLCCEDTSNKREELDISPVGVWVSDSNPHIFISLTQSGKFSFCFSESLIGFGNYSKENSSLSLTNAYSNLTDVLKISLTDNTMTLSGSVRSFESNKVTSIYTVLKKTTAPFPKSFVGWTETFTGFISVVYRNVRKVWTFTTEYSATYVTYSQSKTGQNNTSTQYYFYVYKEGELFFQEKGNDRVQICVFNPDEDRLVSGIDFWDSESNISISF